MKKRNKIFACIQIAIILSIIVCNRGINAYFSQESNEIPDKEYQCCCKSTIGCKNNCCCASYEDQTGFQSGSNKQGKSLQVFINSVNCKQGNDSFFGAPFAVKYFIENQNYSTEEIFLSFLFYHRSLYPPEVFVSLIEKPPQYPA